MTSDPLAQAVANKAVIQQIEEALERGDPAAVDSFYHEDCILNLPEGLLGDGTFKGLENVKNARARAVEMLGISSVRVIEMIADGPTRVVGIVEISGADKAGEPWSMPVIELLDLVDGKLAETTMFWFDTHRLHEVAGDRVNVPPDGTVVSATGGRE